MKINKKLLIIIGITIIFGIFFLMTSNAVLSNSEITLVCKNSAEQFYETRGPIQIFGDTDFSSQASDPLNNWDLGGTRDGTQANPFVIDDYQILGDTDDVLINITGTSYFFTLSNCLLIGGDYGIYMNGVTNGNIEDNEITESVGAGIRIESCNQTRIQYNNVSYGNIGMSLIHAYTIEITGNTIYSQYEGIKTEDSGYNTLSLNNVFNVSYSCISLLRSMKTVLDNNTVTMMDFGIREIEGNGNTLQYNKIFDEYEVMDPTGRIGIFTLASSGIRIEGNLIVNLSALAIEAKDSHYGIYYYNILNHNDAGIHFNHSQGNEIFFNEINDHNTYGVNLDGDCNDNYVSCNVISYNGEYGIIFGGGTHGNMGCNNNFIGNNGDNPTATSQVYIDGESGEVDFHDNYYDDWISGAYNFDGTAATQDSSPLPDPADIYDCVPCTPPILRIPFSLEWIIGVCLCSIVAMVVFIKRRIRNSLS